MSDSISINGAQPSKLTYETALERVMGLADFERSTHSPGHAQFHLERMGLLMERLGNVHLDIPTVHVAGTKGKGSTSAMIASVLSAQGCKTGLYTSPHLHSAVERIRVGMEPVSRQDFAAVVEQIWPAVQWTGKEGAYGAITTFEALTAMAFAHFKNIGADFQVMEVGLGGRLDSTNVVMPEVSVITSISLDHMVTLGDTIAKIAFEKAGIIKHGVPVVVAPQPDEAMEVFCRIAAERNAPLVRVDERVSWRKRSADMRSQSFEMHGLRDTYDLEIPLLGDYQLENAAAAAAAAETLAERGYAISKESIVRGLRDVRWPARLEVLSTPDDGGKLLVVDGAHNPYSVKRLVQAVRDCFSFERVILVFGALGGHSARGMIAELDALSPLVIAVRSRHPRSSSSNAIAEAVRERGLTVAFEVDNVGEGTRRALVMAGENDLVLGTGSLSVAAEIIEEMRGIKPELYPYIKPPSADRRAVV
jgi:dihydrofolate synthase/folylpolyglutamate synthase